MKTLRLFILRRALLARGRFFMARWQRLVDHFGSGDSRVAESFYPRLRVYRRVARRLAFRAGRLA